MHRGTKPRKFALSLLTILFACSCSDKKEPAVKNGGDDPTDSTPVATAGDAPAPGYTISATSWGAATDGKQHKAPEEPPIPVTWEEGQRQKFERDGLKRWKNTEIYVRRDR